MRVRMKREDFSLACFELCLSDAALELSGEKEAFSLPYSQIGDFIITQDSHAKAYFTMTCAGRTYEGRIMEPAEAEAFALALKDKMDGVINIAIQRN